MNKEYSRVFKTHCPYCTKEVRGELKKEGENVFLNRKCEEHGEYKLLLSKNGELYLDFDRFYFSFLKKNASKGKITTYWLFASSECNMNCAHCIVDIEAPLFGSLNDNDFELVLNKFKKNKFTFTGGEPTLHKNLDEFIAKARKKGFIAQIATNGIKLKDFAYLRSLKEAGLQEVRISTDNLGLAYSENNKTLFLDERLMALSNLKSLNIKTILSPIIYKGINEDHLIECLNYAKDNLFVAEISVSGFTWGGKGKQYTKETTMMPDEIVDFINDHYIKTNRKDFFVLNKFIHALIHLLNIELCFNTQLIIFNRKRGVLTSLTKYFNMNKLEKQLEKYEKKN